ncbi:MAG: hypothetical protein ACQEXG_16550 [Pseudomonadota bacterium]
MFFDDKEATVLNEDFLSDIYTSDDISTINNLLSYMAEIKYIPGDLLADAPGIKFVPRLKYDEGV